LAEDAPPDEESYWIKDEEVAKPYANEHSCRLQSPDKYDRFARQNCKVKHDGKCIDFIFGVKEGKSELQAMRYKTDVWEESAARAHCKSKDGTFEPAAKEEAKGVIPFKETPKAPEDTPWDGPGEIREAEVSDLKVMCAWFDSENPDIKGSYKLPHHKAKGHAVVWKGVAASMAVLFGARGGVDVPAGDRKGIYNHLVKHYKQFDKEPPEFREYDEEDITKFEDDLDIQEELDREKEGRVLSEKNRTLIRKVITVLQELLTATEPPKQDSIKLEDNDPVVRLEEKVDAEPSQSLGISGEEIAGLIAEAVKTATMTAGATITSEIRKLTGKVG
jgi:hypothetical protein